MSDLQTIWIQLYQSLIPVELTSSGNDLGAPVHESDLAGPSAPTRPSLPPPSPVSPGWRRAAQISKSRHLGRCSGEAKLPKFALKGRGLSWRGNGGDWLDKIHCQRLTTNICRLAAAINMTREDKMKNSKGKNQRPCQKLSERVFASHSAGLQPDKAGVAFLEKQSVIKHDLKAGRWFETTFRL